MVTIDVYYRSSGNRAPGKAVSLAFFSPPSSTETKFTDKNGSVDFNAEPKRGKVFADHKCVYEGNIAGRMKVYI